MRAVISRVRSAVCQVDGQTTGAIQRGLLVYLGVLEGDGDDLPVTMARKLTQLRIFPDEDGRMNRSVADIGGGILLIPNFTLAARTKKGTRPSFTDAAAPPVAERLYQRVADECGKSVTTATGRFGADMRIESVADGPVTIILDV